MSEGTFTMTTDSASIPVSGRQKAAILLGELGIAGSKNVLSFLQPDEVQKLRKAMNTLGDYSPFDNNFRKVQAREIKVLEETCKFGVKHRFLDPSVLERKDLGFIKLNASPTENNIRKTLSDNPEMISNILRNWLEEE